jgi:RND family efflux transporter MFP subunit
VTVALPREQQLPDFRDYTGRVEAMETEEVRARVKGFLQKICFSEGTEVKAGALLYEIDPRTYQADLEKAKAEVHRFDTLLEQTTGEARRAADLRASRSLSEEEFQQKLAARNVADAGLKQAKAALESAKLELGFTEIRARIGGRIGRTLVTEGNLVGYNQPTLLTTIVRLDPVYVYFEETERGLEDFDQLVRVRGAKTIADAKIPVRAELAWESEFPHQGNLDFRDNKIDPGTGTIQVRALVPNPRHALTPGQFVRVRVTMSEPRRRLLVPEQALGRDPSGKFLLIVKDDDTVEQRPVTTGQIHNDLIAIESGLTGGERVIVSGLQRARPGADVVPRMMQEKEDAK